jgi:hypothetical protein
MARAGQVATVIGYLTGFGLIAAIPFRIRRSIRRYERTGRRDRWTTPQVPDGLGLYGTMSPQPTHDLGKPGTLPHSSRDRHGEL